MTTPLPADRNHDGVVDLRKAMPAPTEYTHHQHVHVTAPQQPYVAMPVVPAGWYPDQVSPGILRWHDGSQWTEHRQPAAAHQPVQPQIVIAPQAYAQSTVVFRRSGVNHGLHLVLTIITCGMWLPVWILLAVIDAVSR